MQLESYSTTKPSPIWLLHCDSCQHCHLFCSSDPSALQSQQTWRACQFSLSTVTMKIT